MEDTHIGPLFRIFSGLPELRSVAMVESERCVDGKTSAQTRYYVSSLAGDADRLLKTVRGHWEVENTAHWTLDVSLGRTTAG